LAQVVVSVNVTIGLVGVSENRRKSAAHRRRDERYFTEIAVLDAGLSGKQEAVRDAQHAVELVPISKDALFGPALEQNLAWVYAWTGEPGLAIEKLEMLSKIPVDVSYDLRFNPVSYCLRVSISISTGTSSAIIETVSALLLKTKPN
jgi:hypothetical protein